MNTYKVVPAVKYDRRMVETKKLLTDIDLSIALSAEPGNYFSQSLGIHLFIDKDLNYWSAKESCAFNIVTSFEVLEHLQNPLKYLHSIRNVLRYGGRLYMTTPISWWMGKGKHHFKEYSKEELTWILKAAGFKTIKITRFRAYQIKRFGVRPLIRLLRDILWGQCWFIIASKEIC